MVNGLINKRREKSRYNSSDERGDDIGAKYDSGKPRCSLVIGGFPNALMSISRVATFGAEKYSDNGWRYVDNGEARYLDAAMRHLLSHLSGENIDDESGEMHIAHFAWNVLAHLELILTRKEDP